MSAGKAAKTDWLTACYGALPQSEKPSESLHKLKEFFVGDRIAVFLVSTAPEKKEYTAPASEHSFFKINDGGALYSYSDFNDLSRFDGRAVKEPADECARLYGRFVV